MSHAAAAHAWRGIAPLRHFACMATAIAYSGHDTTIATAHSAHYSAAAPAATPFRFHDMPHGGSVTSSSAAVGWMATHRSRSAFVAPIFTATPKPCPTPAAHAQLVSYRQRLHCAKLQQKPLLRLTTRATLTHCAQHCKSLPATTNLQHFVGAKAHDVNAQHLLSRLLADDLHVRLRLGVRRHLAAHTDSERTNTLQHMTTSDLQQSPKNRKREHDSPQHRG